MAGSAELQDGGGFTRAGVEVHVAKCFADDAPVHIS